MCQCGCGDTNLDAAVRISGTDLVLGYQIYRGCQECFRGPGVSVTLYDNDRSEWLHGVRYEPPVTPNEYGGNAGHGISMGLFEVRDLKAEASEISKETSIGPGDDQYANLEDWLDDFGLRLVQGAMRRFRERLTEERRKRKTGKL